MDPQALGLGNLAKYRLALMGMGAGLAGRGSFGDNIGEGLQGLMLGYRADLDEQDRTRQQMIDEQERAWKQSERAREASERQRTEQERQQGIDWLRALDPRLREAPAYFADDIAGEVIGQQFGAPADPGFYEQEMFKDQLKRRSEQAGQQEGLDTVMQMVDQLEQKITTDRAGFEASTGPLEGSDSYFAAPFKGVQEIYATGSGTERENLARLDRIKSDAQAINSALQRALLKGGGAITENERTQINKILGAIATARSADDALAQLDNFRSLAGALFGVQGQPAAGGGGAVDWQEYFR